MKLKKFFFQTYVCAVNSINMSTITNGNMSISFKILLKLFTSVHSALKEHTKYY